MSNLLERLGVNVAGEQFRPKNVAAVFVTAALPPFARAGGQIDVTVSAIGDAKSLLGGTLIMTPLNGADGADLCRGAGCDHCGRHLGRGCGGERGSGCADRRDHPLGRAGRARGRVRLRSPAHDPAACAAGAGFYHGRADRDGRSTRPWARVATMQDAGTVRLNMDAAHMASPAHVIARLENLEVEPESRARVVVDQRIGHHRDGRRCADQPRRGRPGQSDAADRRDPDGGAAQPLCGRRDHVVPRTSTLESRMRRAPGWPK